MKQRILCKRLHRGDDLLVEIKKLAKEEKIQAGVVLSSVGCVTKLRVRDASGVTIKEVEEPCEILSVNGTVSMERTHLHIAASRQDLSVIGGHMVEGCIINTTCELMIADCEEWSYGMEQDQETGYDEIIFLKKIGKK